MNIYCKECSKLVGEIRDASIRKNTTYLCGDCNGKNKRPKQDNMDHDALSTLRKMFGMG